MTNRNETLIAFARDHAEKLVEVLPMGVGNTLSGIADALAKTQDDLAAAQAVIAAAKAHPGAFLSNFNILDKDPAEALSADRARVRAETLAWAASEYTRDGSATGGEVREWLHDLASDADTTA